MKVAVIGTGYVGLVTGVVLAELGHDVTCVDNDAHKRDMINAGIPPIYEAGLEELLKRMLSEERFRVTASIPDATRACDVVFIAVGTPPGEDGTPDLTAVRAVAKEIGPAISKPTIVVNKSTVPIGTGDLVEKLLIDAGADPAMFDIVSSPEFLGKARRLRMLKSRIGSFLVPSVWKPHSSLWSFMQRRNVRCTSRIYGAQSSSNTQATAS
jgi:UDPglucose 6-dehydrogenase